MPANAKWYRNLVVAESIVAALRARGKGWKSTLERRGREARAELSRVRRRPAGG